MHDLQFTIKDCDDVVRQWLHLDVHTVDFEVIPRHKNNYIFKITIERDSKEETLCFYAKTNASTPKLDKIVRKIQASVPDFSASFTPKFVCGKSELSFFEDLTCQKFQTHLDLFTLKHLHQTLNVLAQLHAAGFAFETKEGKVEETDLDDSSFDKKLAEDLLWSVLDKKENVPELVNNFEQSLVSSKFRKTLCHCNLTSKNVMFQYENGVPSACKLVNFKPKFAPPLYDVLQLIFFNTRAELRQQNFESLLQHYHNCLQNGLQNHSLDVSEILPVADLRLSCHDLLPLIKLETALYWKRNVTKYEETLFNKTCQELKEILASPRVTREDCYVIVRNNIGTTEYDLLSFSTIQRGNCLKLKIQINHNLEEKSINCFVKTKSKERGGCFNKEVFIYETLVPKLQHCRIDAINDCVQPCYFQRAEDLLVFEDLSLQNYQCLPAGHTFNFTLLSMVVKKLAKFHASFFVFEETMSEQLKKAYQTNDEYNEYLKETSTGDDLKASLQSIVDVVELFPDLKTKTNEENLKKYLPNLVESFNSAGSTSDRFKNVLCHGNLATNNVFIQFDDDRPHDCCFVNFENLRYCPPAHDFLSVIYLTTDRDTRSKYEEVLQELYYEELGQIVSSYNYNAGKFFSYQEFLDSVKSARPQMVVQALMYSMVKVSSVLNSGDICEDRVEELKKVCQGSGIFKERLRENVSDLYQQCNVFSLV